MSNRRRAAPKDLLIEARRIADRGDLVAAEEALASLVKDYPQDDDAHFYYGAVLFRSKSYAAAIPHFEEVLKDNPTHEWASICLFHSLWKIDKKHEALDEIRRFRSEGGDSMEYRRLLRDIRNL